LSDGTVGAERDPALSLIDVARMRGLEIGPLSRPRVKKSEGKVFYVDHRSTEELRRAYSANSLMRPHLDEIVEVDYVIKDGAALSEAVSPDGPFDYLIASHVIEHLADPIGWLRDASRVLSGDGLVSLVVPDKRFCFDINREPTRPADWVDWHLRGLRAPSFGQLFDFFAHVTTIDGMIDTLGVWAGTADYAGARRNDVPDADLAAFLACERHKETGEYMDVHAGVYTPASLLSLIGLSVKLGLLPYEVAHFVPTRRDSLEFYLVLRFCTDRDRALGSVEEAARELAAADAPEAVPLALVAPASPPSAEAAPDDASRTAMELTPRERDMVLRARALRAKWRGLLGN